MHGPLNVKLQEMLAHKAIVPLGFQPVGGTSNCFHTPFVGCNYQILDFKIIFVHKKVVRNCKILNL
jgi:hypothetical protein